MDNEKLNNEEELEVTEAVDEVETVSETESAEAIEETAEVTEEADDIAADEADAAEETDEADEAAADEIAEYGEAVPTEVKKGVSGKLIAVIGGAVVIVLAVVAILWNLGVINPYEKGYVDVSGLTLEEVADQSGYTLKEYKKVNGLPFLMSKKTHENAVRNHVTLKATIAQSGMSFEDFKEYYGWGDHITEDSTVGEALGETRLAVVLGVAEQDEDAANEMLKSFKEFYEFDEDVTLDTLYKDVRNKIDEKTRQSRIEEEEKAAEAEDEKSDKADDAEDKAEDDAEEKADDAEEEKAAE